MAESSQTQLLDRALFGRLVESARSSVRRRVNHNFHSGPDDNPHRFLNVFLEGSYVTPHRHLSPPKSEAFLVLDGWMAAFVFDDAGAICETHLLGAGAKPDHLPKRFQNLEPRFGIDLPPGPWHTVVALTPWAVCYEVKPGPWDPSTDKEFAPWAPRENEPSAKDYLARLTR